MPPDVEKLLLLQSRDQKLRAIRSELHNIPLETAALEKRISDAGRHMEELKAAIQQLEVDRRKLEVEVGSKGDSIAKYKTQQQQTRKNDEYQALAHEIERFTSDISAIEDRELEIMEKAEALQRKLQAAKETFEVEKRRIEANIADAKSREAALRKQEADIEEERKPLVQDLDEEVLSVYDRLMKSKKDSAVVALEHDFCTGCHMKLTTQTSVRVRGAREIVHCENCGRILYAQA